MPEIRVVSTFNPKRWGSYVERNIASWVQHVDGEAVVYHEGPKPDYDGEGVIWRQWEDIPGAKDFVDEALRFPAACGQFGGRYDYNFDAAKFSRKVFAQCDAAEEHTDILMWLDSDVEVTRTIDAGLLEELLLGMPMARYERPGFHSETGIVIWDMRHEICKEFFRAYRMIHINRRVYCLAGGWHDCWALDFVVSQMAIATANLTKGVRDFKSPHANLEVVRDSQLGAYLRHDKGPSKHAA